MKLMFYCWTMHIVEVSETETQAASLLVLAAMEQFPLSSELLCLGHWCWAFVSDLAGFSACTHSE